MHHIQSWWNYRHLPNILFVHYNDLKENLTGEIRRIADFLAIPWRMNGCRRSHRRSVWRPCASGRNGWIRA